MMSVKELNEIFQNDRFASGCGIEIIESGPGHAKCSMLITEKHINGLGTLMGGAMFTLADYTFSVAANSHGHLAVTLDAFISFIRPCSKGTVVADATETSRTGRTGVYNVVITDEDNKIIGSVTGTCYFKSR